MNFIVIVVLQGFDSMTVVTIPLIEDPCRSDHQERKVSSSSCREDKLGTLLKIPEVGVTTPVYTLSYLTLILAAALNDIHSHSLTILCLFTRYRMRSQS